VRYVNHASVLAAVGGSYVVGGLAIAAAVLALGGISVLFIAARRRRSDRLAVRRTPLTER
jgi:hypothetical protein